ncbi:MAG TPA: NnrS family protein [Terriglobales bacterium]|nr:NnrS family protein [Terriglobales bacterium]
MAPNPIELPPAVMFAGADPARERRAARLLAAFLATGLFFLAMPGTLIGVGNLLLIALQRAPQAPPTAWIQAHGQAQIFGWVGSFILGISLFILPRLRGRALASLPAGWSVWLLWTGGVTLRWLTGVGDLPAHPYLAASAGLELAAWALALAVLMAPRRCVQVFGSVLGYAGFCGLGITLLVNLMGALQAAPGTAMYPPELDRELVELALWAFILPIVVSYSTRLVSGFLGLRPHRFATALPGRLGRLDLFALLALAVAAWTVAVLQGAFLVADALALAMVAAAIWALRIFEPSATSPSQVPGVYGGYPTFIRIAYGWLLLGAVLALLAHAIPLLPGLGGAARHAVTVGFIATLIFSLGPRMLPTFLNHRQLFSSTMMALSLWVLTLGCALRVVSEAASYGAPGSWTWSWLPLSAYLELTAVLLFVANLGLTLVRSPRAGVRQLAMGGEPTA